MDINLYVDRDVRVELKDGSMLTGKLSKNEVDDIFVVGDICVEYINIKDVLYHSELDLDDHKLTEGTVVTSDGFLIDLQEIIKLFGKDYQTGEKTVEFYCHIFYNKNIEKCYLQDFHVINKRHAVNRKILENGAFLYRIDNGPYFCALLEGDHLCTEEKRIPFDVEKITDITVCPQFGKQVTVILNDGNQITSKVIDISFNGITLKDGYSGCIHYSDIYQLRYQGKMNGKPKEKRCGDYLFRHRNLRQPSYRFQTGSIAEFAVGMTKRGLVCKDVDVKGFTEIQQSYGVLSDYVNTQGFGYVDLMYEYGVKNECAYYLQSIALGKKWSERIDTHKYLYVVKFHYTYNTKHENKTIDSVEVVKHYERHKYRSIKVDSQGNVTAELFETPEDIKGVIEEGYGFLYSFDCRKKSGGPAFIYLNSTQKNSETYYCSLASSVAKFKGEPLNTRDNYYVVKYWRDNREHIAENEYPKVYKIEIIGIRSKMKDYYISENGVITDYDCKEFEMFDRLLDEKVVIITKNKNRYFGILQNNDKENDQLIVRDEDTLKRDIHYSNVLEVWGLSTVNRYDTNGSFGFINNLNSNLYYKNIAVQSKKYPKLEWQDKVAFTLERVCEGPTQEIAKIVRPYIEKIEEAFVIGVGKNGSYHVVVDDNYGKEQHVSAKPEQLCLLNPQISFEDLKNKDYKVQLYSIYFEDGTFLLRGIKRKLEAYKKLHFGYVKNLCDNPPVANVFSFGRLVPLDMEERGKFQEGIYFDDSRNAEFFKQATLYNESSNNTKVCFVSYQIDAVLQENQYHISNVNFIGYYSSAWFETLPLSKKGTIPNFVTPTHSVVLEGTIESKIQTCLKINDWKYARELLEEYAKQKGYTDRFYYQKLYEIYEREYRGFSSLDVRRKWIDCICKLRKLLEGTDEYDYQLTIIDKQAYLYMKDGQENQAKESYRDWIKLYKEYCNIYPDKRKTYQTLANRVIKILGTEILSSEDGLDDESIDFLDMDLHAYLEWRLDTIGEKNTLWEKAAKLRQKSGDEYMEALKATVKEELYRIPKEHYRTKAHFALLNLMLDPCNSMDSLLPYFAGALQCNNSFPSIVKMYEFSTNKSNTPCSYFTLYSLILFSKEQMDVQTWLNKFEDEDIRKCYIKELCCLLDEETERFDGEELGRVFNIALKKIKEPIGRGLQLQEYIFENDKWIKKLESNCGVRIPTQLKKVINSLKKYNSQKDFASKIYSLRTNATLLQIYFQKICKDPSVYDWNLFQPMCARLLGKIQNTWSNLLRNSIPSVEIGEDLYAERETDDTWKVTIPLSNKKGRQNALGIKFSDFEMSSKNEKNLLGDGREHAFTVFVKPKDPDEEHLSIKVRVTYQYISDIQFCDAEYKEIKEERYTEKEILVSCVPKQRKELTLDVLTALGRDAKEKIDTSIPSGQAVAEIFKNRSEEIDIILGAISTGEKGSRKLLSDGRWVSIYGQWRVGKSVVLREVHRALKDKEFCEQAITVYTQFLPSDDFEAATVDNICDAMYQANYDLWDEHLCEWEKKLGDISTLHNLARVLNDFQRKLVDKTIVLALDEFTAVYYAIKKGSVDVNFLRKFIEFINQSECVVLTAGGEHTVKLMADFDVNMMQKADCLLEIKYLSKANTTKYIEAVISEASYLGTAEQKDSIINRIFDLTQGNVFLLRLFCEDLVHYVQKKSGVVRISDITIQKTIDWIASRGTDVIGIYFNSLYNPYNESKEETIAGFGEVKELNLKILQTIVNKAFPETHRCPKSVLKDCFKDEERFDAFLEVLVERGVVNDDTVNVYVPIDLYYEIQSRLNGKDD